MDPLHNSQTPRRHTADDYGSLDGLLEHMAGMPPQDRASMAASPIENFDSPWGNLHLDMQSAVYVAREVLADEEVLSMVYLEEYATADPRALSYLAQLETFTLHVNLENLTPDLATILGSAKTQELSLGDRMDIAMLATHAQFDPAQEICLDFSHFAHIDEQTAQRLVQCGAGELSFWAFEKLSLRVLESLAAFEGNLRLHTDRSVSNDMAQALSRYRGKCLEIFSSEKPCAEVIYSLQHQETMNCHLSSKLNEEDDTARWTLRFEPCHSYQNRLQLAGFSLAVQPRIHTDSQR